MQKIHYRIMSPHFLMRSRGKISIRCDSCWKSTYKVMKYENGLGSECYFCRDCSDHIDESNEAFKTIFTLIMAFSTTCFGVCFILTAPTLTHILVSTIIPLCLLIFFVHEGNSSGNDSACHELD